MKPTIVFDIDGTLANLDHRLHFVNGPKKDWKEFLARVKDDLPIEQTILLNQILHMETGYDIVCASGRSENERRDTEEWLAKYGVHYNKLYMRPAEDYRPDYIIKKEILAQMRHEGREPFMIFDDRQSVVDMWRAEGLFVLQCAPKETFLDFFNFHPSLSRPLTILVGPSGAGKSTWFENYSDKPEWRQRIISSDVIREQICGNFRDQSQNERVFQAMHKLAHERLKLGLPVVLDATHIRTADRIKAVKLVPVDVPVTYAVIDRPLEEKMKTAGWRSSVSIKGKSLVETHHHTMQSNLKAILAGDGLPNVDVVDLRKIK